MRSALEGLWSSSSVAGSQKPAEQLAFSCQACGLPEPPRVLAVDRPLGYPLGEPNNADLQKRIMMEALGQLAVAVSEPLAVAFPAEVLPARDPSESGKDEKAPFSTRVSAPHGLQD